MATIKNIRINRNWGKRPVEDYIVVGNVWLVKKGQEYHCVQFSINELDMPYMWGACLCVPCDWTDEQIEKVVKEYAQDEITEKDILDYRTFLKDGERWGWD